MHLEPHGGGPHPHAVVQDGAAPASHGAPAAGASGSAGHAPPSRRGAGGRRAAQAAASGRTASGAGAKAPTAPVTGGDATPRSATAPTLLAKGLDGPERRAPVQYSAPSIDGEAGRGSQVSSGSGGVAAAEKDGQTFPGTPRNAQCPCGSGKKYKLCHGKNEA